jgi:hypothetical protein
MRGKFGSKNPRYRGGRTTDRNGYIKLLIGNVDGRAVYELEHRLVMQGIIGRPLLKTETVHHKNGIRSDNRPENLELWNSGHPGGQRVSDLVAFARQIIELYGDVDAKG